MGVQKKSGQKQQMLSLLDEIGSSQKKIDNCRVYYQSLEQDIETKRETSINAEDRESLTRQIAVLNQEFEEKMSALYEGLNEHLLRGRDLASSISGEIGHDFRLLWDYMTRASKEEVETQRVLQDIDCIKRDLSK